MAEPKTTVCPCGCGAAFLATEHGNRVKRWASTSCKKRIEGAARRWAMRLFELGLIGPETLRPYLPGNIPEMEPRAAQDVGAGGPSGSAAP